MSCWLSNLRNVHVVLSKLSIRTAKHASWAVSRVFYIVYINYAELLITPPLLLPCLYAFISFTFITGRTRFFIAILKPSHKTCTCRLNKQYAVWYFNSESEKMQQPTWGKAKISRGYCPPPPPYPSVESLQSPLAWSQPSWPFCCLWHHWPRDYPSHTLYLVWHKWFCLYPSLTG